MSERVKIILDKNADILRLPAIALRGLVVFPGNIIHFEVGRKKSIAAIEWAMSNNNAVFLTAQQDMDVEDPGFKDLYAYGVVAEVKQVLRVSDELVKVLVEGKYRAKLLTLDSSGRFLLASTKAAALREQYNVTVLPQGKKLGKQLGQLEAAGFAGAAFMDKDEVKIFAQQ